MILYKVQHFKHFCEFGATLLKIANYLRRSLCPPYNSCMPGNQGAMVTMGIIGATREAN